MISHCGNEWLSEIARREFWAGFGDGLLLGMLFVSLVAACIVARALSEVEPE